jgi:hypothetical protein
LSGRKTFDTACCTRFAGAGMYGQGAAAGSQAAVRRSRRCFGTPDGVRSRRALSPTTHPRTRAVPDGRADFSLEHLAAIVFDSTLCIEPAPDHPARATVEPTSEARYRIQLNASSALKEKLEFSQALVCHSTPNGDVAAYSSARWTCMGSAIVLVAMHSRCLDVSC